MHLKRTILRHDLTLFAFISFDQISFFNFLVIIKVTETCIVPGNPYRRGRLSTVDLLIKIGCFVKKKNTVSL